MEREVGREKTVDVADFRVVQLDKEDYTNIDIYDYLFINRPPALPDND